MDFLALLPRFLLFLKDLLCLRVLLFFCQDFNLNNNLRPLLRILSEALNILVNWRLLSFYYLPLLSIVPFKSKVKL